MRLLLTILILSGCTAAFRTTSGGATAPDGVSSGTTNSLYFADRGGLLTRAGLAALGVLAAAGSVENVKRESTVTDNNDGTVTVHTRTTGTFNAQTAQEASDILSAASDPHQNFGGLTGGLEIASTKLGGDTSGWMFEFGYAYSTTFHNRWGWEGSAKLMFGAYTFHDRMIATLDSGAMLGAATVTMMTGDAGYQYFGFPVRAGITYRLQPHTILEAFAKLEPNLYPKQSEASGIEFPPSPWRVGGRFTLAEYFYAEADVRFSALRGSATSYGLEVGFAF